MAAGMAAGMAVDAKTTSTVYASAVKTPPLCTIFKRITVHSGDVLAFRPYITRPF